MDSGQEKRYSKFKAINNDEFQEIVKTSLNTRKGRYFANNEYKHYKSFSESILKDTQNRREKGILFNKNGDILLVKLGTKSAIKFSDEEKALFNGNKFIHNHPSGNGLSSADVSLAVHSGLQEVVAVSSNQMYRLVLKSNLDLREIMVEYYKSQRKVSSLFQIMHATGKVTEGQLSKEFDHFVLSVFSKSTKGVNYESKRY